VSSRSYGRYTQTGVTLFAWEDKRLLRPGPRREPQPAAGRPVDQCRAEIGISVAPGSDSAVVANETPG
jgi:hypothetical protein